ncbi:DNA polymerase I, partial [bacterium]|nr:DNA polymerase I [bacterium]
EFAEYKAQRPEMPDDLQSQIPLIKEVISAFNIPLFELEGYEADDILATLARRAEKEGMDVFILTPDKDILQIVGANIKVLSFHKEGLIYDEDKVRERFGVRPQEMPDLMSLMGDSSDNIPGVPGIGEKTAAKLIQEFESLESVLNNLERIPNKKQRESLKKFSEQAELSKRLATIDEKVPLSVDFQQLRSGEANRERLAEIFRELEFRKLVEEITLEGRESQELFADLD